jgi:hypothetical protein
MTDKGSSPICPLFGRDVPPDVPQSLYHLIPKLHSACDVPFVPLI